MIAPKLTLLQKYVSRSTEPRFCSPVDVRQSAPRPYATRYSTQFDYREFPSSSAHFMSTAPVLVSCSPNVYQKFNQPLQTPSKVLLVPLSQFNGFHFVSQMQLPHATVSNAALNILFVPSNFFAPLPPTTTKPVFAESLLHPFPDPQPFPPSSITVATFFAATSHPVPTNAISTTTDTFSRLIASFYLQTLQPATYITTHIQPPAINLASLQLPMFDGDPLKTLFELTPSKQQTIATDSITDTP